MDVSWTSHLDGVLHALRRHATAWSHFNLDGSQLNITNSTASKSGHYDGEKSPLFPSAMGLGFFMISDLDGISSLVESLDPTFFPSGAAQIFGEVEAAYGYDA
jgi:hypothetical protein